MTDIPIKIHHEDDAGNIITLLDNLTVIYDYKVITIPEGFRSDGFSTPRILWSTISPAIDQRTLRAAICHDYIYRVQPAGWTRKDADLMLYQFCREDGLSWWPAQKAYYGLRLFGGTAWNDSAKKIKENNNDQ